MRVDVWLQLAEKRLKADGIATARLDSLVLLEDEFGRDRAHILAHGDAEIPKITELALNKKIAQRANHTPLAYIRGKTEFYGREFIIDHHVLVPRPESETMIDLLLGLPLSKNPKITDIGTGCGALAITAKLELSSADVTATDIDAGALKTARKNAKKLVADIHFLQGNLLEPLQSNVHHPTSIILANLPYVPDRYKVNQAAAQEPKHAIFGGKDGLNLYRLFWEQVSVLPQKPKFILTEALPTQHQDLENIANSASYKHLETEDFIQVFRLP